MRDRSVVETWSYLTKEIQKSYPDLAYLHMTEPRADLIDEHSVNKIDPLGHFRQSWKEPFISASRYSDAVESTFDMVKKIGDLIACGHAFIDKPNLMIRLLNNQPLFVRIMPQNISITLLSYK